MQKIKILDCTLRDGGYLNDWKFGSERISSLIDSLSDIDVIECGFLSDRVSFDPDKTLFPDISAFLKVFPKGTVPAPALMVNMGEYNLNDIEPCNVEIRVAFKPYHLKDLYDYVKPLSEKKMQFSLNAMHISLYSDSELSELAEISNSLVPVSLTAVDTMGLMEKSDTVRIFSFLDKKLKRGIDLGFHSHNNLGLSFENTKDLLNLGLDRGIIIDSCLSGVGRGGGMLDTEDIAIYLNDTYSMNYRLILPADLTCYLKSINKEDKHPYFISAKFGCHPNYAKYLVDMGCSYDLMSEVFNLIPSENKPYFSVEIIESIFDKKNSLIYEEV